MVLLARPVAFAALTRNLDSAVVHLNLHVIPRETGNLRRDDVLVGGLVDVNRGNPAGRVGREPVQTLLDGQQIADRIPSRKGHAVNLA